MTAQELSPEQESSHEPLPSPSTLVTNASIVVIGNGPVGVHLVKELRRQGFTGSIRLFGDEKGTPYDRVLLSSYLFGNMAPEQLDNDLSNLHIFEHVNTRISFLDLLNKQIQDQYGHWHRYDHLILATGSRPHIPEIPGVDQTGVYQLRSREDAEHLLARKVRSQSTVVIGAGLLGLEAASAMNRYGTKVTVVQHAHHILNHQLDAAGASILADHYASKGIDIYCATRCTKILSGQDGRVCQAVLANGEVINCDTVIVATGIRPNTELALLSGLSVGHGIRIDDTLQTSFRDVYAIGECAQHQDKIYGLVGPGLEQASVLAARLSGKEAQYSGSQLASRLKVSHFPVFSAGEIHEEESRETLRTIEFRQGQQFRKLFLSGSKIKGFIALGEYPNSAQVQELLDRQGRIYPWQIARFKSKGDLWPEQQQQLPSQWPENRVVCNCRNVPAGRINEFVAQCANPVTVADIQANTSAGTVCGTCVPLLQSYEKEAPLPQGQKSAYDLLIACSILVALVWSVFLLIPPLPGSESVQSPLPSDWWTQSVTRQWTGFTVLGLSTLAMLVALRKRWQKFNFLSFDLWRLTHIGLFTLALIILFAHTGLTIGHGVNRWLLLNTLVLIISGALLGLVSGLGLKGNPWFQKHRRNWNLAHIFLGWPLPVLLIFHILSVYYF